MTSLATLSAALRATRSNLSTPEATFAAEALASPSVADAEKSDFLVALSEKGESAAEIAAFARSFQAVAIDPGVGRWSPKAIDIVGTGGDHAGGFNVSSLVVLLLSCAGVPVMKHGNRGVTSKCGSADLLSGLGYDISAPADKLREGLDKLGYVFFFAPSFHPAFKHIAPVRKALAAQGRRTVFNILGPLINPGRPAHILLGVYSPAWVDPLAEALSSLGSQAGLAIHGIIGEGKGIDEMTVATRNRVRGVGRLASVSGEWQASDFGLPISPFSDLLGGDLPENLGLVNALVEGRAPKGLEDTVVLNAAVALWVCGRTRRVEEGIPEARKLLVGGAVKEKVAATRRFFGK